MSATPLGVAGDVGIRALDRQRPREDENEQQRRKPQSFPRIAGQFDSSPRKTGRDHREAEADEREGQQPAEVGHGDEVLEEIEDAHDDQRRQDERQPGRFPWEKTAEDDRAADHVKADQKFKQQRAQDEHSQER